MRGMFSDVIHRATSGAAFKPCGLLVLPAVLGSLLSVPLCAQDKQPPKKYALLVGINKYRHAVMNADGPLRYAEADVTELAELLKRSGYEVDLLLGRRATKAAIEAEADRREGRNGRGGAGRLGRARRAV